MKDFINLYNKLVVKINEIIESVYILEKDCNKNYKKLNENYDNIKNKLSNINIDIDYSNLEFNTDELINFPIGLVNDDNTLSLLGMKDGTYSLKYEYEDGTQEELFSFEVGGLETSNLIEVGELSLNTRYSKSGGGLVARNGAFTVIYPIEGDGVSTYMLTFENLKTTIKYTNSVLYFLTSDNTALTVNGSCDFSAMTEGCVVESDDKSTATVTFVPPVDVIKFAVTIVVNTETDTEITEDDFSDYIITLKKVI